jgi:hypothetical protein
MIEKQGTNFFEHLTYKKILIPNLDLPELEPHQVFFYPESGGAS